MEANIQPMLTPPPHGGVAAGEIRRARKRSRYLSPPYTDDLAVVQQEEEELPPNVCAADVLSALHAAALLDLDPNAAQALRFLALYMRKRTTRASFADKLPSPPHVAAAGVGHDELLNLTPGPAAIPMAHGSPTPAPAKKRKNPLDTAAATKQQDDAILKNAAAALQEAMPSQADFAVHATDGVATSVPPKTKKKKKNKRSWQVRNPVALVLDFAEGAPLPSKDELLSTFRRLGFVINPEETDIAKEERSARVVFATRAEAEAAYSYAQTLGAMGPPFAAPRLQDLPPIMLNEPPPLPKLPLTDIRRNLDKMISSLNSTQAAKPAVGTLVGEMQRLLAKVDKMLQGASSTANHH